MERLERRRNVVWKVMNRRLTILGVERGMFFVCLSLCYGLWSLYDHLPLAIGTFVVLVIAARQATAEDPQMLRVLLGSGRFRPSYDPMKWADPQITVVHDA